MYITLEEFVKRDQERLRQRAGKPSKAEVLPGRMQVRIRPQVWTSEQIKEIEYAQRELTRIKSKYARR
jgi:hypothetical protein